MPDRTKIEFKVESEVDQVARFLPWANPQWLSGDSMMIPAGEPDATHSFAFDATTVLGAVTEGELPDGAFTIHAAGLHMHTLGTSGTLEIRRAEGDDTCLLDIPAWNFHWQGGYELREPVTVNPGDQLSIECHWDNTAENQQVVGGRPLEPRDVTWGEGTTDEMCLGGFYVTSAL